MNGRHSIYDKGPFSGRLHSGCFGLENGRFARHNRGMVQFLPDPITEAELAALEHILACSPSCTVEPQILERLIVMGYAKVILGCLIVTEDGLLLIKTRK
jgi:hypothetical protein